MAVPTITDVSPTTGWTGGQVIKITGTNFRLPTTPAADFGGKLPAPLPTVEVKFGSVASERVWVRSDTLLEALAPVADPGVADVSVQNLDDDGDPIAGETVTSVGGFTYLRPKLTDKPDFQRVIEQVIIEFRRQVLENTSISSHVDFDAEVGGQLDLTHIGKLPAVVLAGPDVVEQRIYSTNEWRDVALDANTFERHRAPQTVTLEFEVIALSEFAQQLIALEALVLQFFNRNPFLRVLRDPDDVAAGTADFEMAWEIGTTFRNTTTPNESNTKSVLGTFVVRGVLLEDIAGFDNETLDRTSGIVDDVVTNSEAL